MFEDWKRLWKWQMLEDRPKGDTKEKGYLVVWASVSADGRMSGVDQLLCVLAAGSARGM